jgi:hypothetical protein
MKGSARAPNEPKLTRSMCRSSLDVGRAACTARWDTMSATKTASSVPTTAMSNVTVAFAADSACDCSANTTARAVKVM